MATGVARRPVRIGKTIDEAWRPRRTDDKAGKTIRTEEAEERTTAEVGRAKRIDKEDCQRPEADV